MSEVPPFNSPEVQSERMILLYFLQIVNRLATQAEYAGVHARDPFHPESDGAQFGDDAGRKLRIWTHPPSMMLHLATPLTLRDVAVLESQPNGSDFMLGVMGQIAYKEIVAVGFGGETGDQLVVAQRRYDPSSHQALIHNNSPLTFGGLVEIDLSLEGLQPMSMPPKIE